MLETYRLDVDRSIHMSTNTRFLRNVFFISGTFRPPGQWSHAMLRSAVFTSLLWLCRSSCWVRVIKMINNPKSRSESWQPTNSLLDCYKSRLELKQGFNYKLPETQSNCQSTFVDFSHPNLSQTASKVAGMTYSLLISLVQVKNKLTELLT